MQAHFVADQVDHVLRIGLVHHGEIVAKPGGFGVDPEEPVGRCVKSAAPDAAGGGCAFCDNGRRSL